MSRLAILFSLSVLLSCAQSEASVPGGSDDAIPKALSLSPADLSFTSIGSTAEIDVTVLDDDDEALPSSTVRWETSDASVARVDANGLVTAMGNGTASITARAGSVAATTSVAVRQVSDAIFISMSSLSLEAEGDTSRLSATVFDQAGSEFAGADMKWGSSDPTVATVSDDGLVTARAEGSARISVTSGTVSESIPVTVSFGLIAFTSQRDGSSNIFVMKSDGSQQTNLTNSTWLDAHPVWSPDGTKIAFVSQRNGNSDIYVMNADGSNPVQLTSNAANDDWPSWSPDGRRIAFASTRVGPFADIYVMQADGSNKVNITNSSSSVDIAPSWSPDGSKIVFSRAAGSDLDIWVMHADGSGPWALTDNETEDHFPAWSPDGTRIAFTAETNGSRAVHVMTSYGTRPVRLTNHDGAQDAYPTWSPDGSKIVFVSERDGERGIYVMDADGSNQRDLSVDGGTDSQPAWGR
ncbi:MAG: Ig-like domain-containing protein [Halobacteriales archaeon]|nr:Ig-like domain-containing protein [Halobacteriales archaeon]